MGGYRVAPEGVRVRNPSFDVTPAAIITAIITEAGVATAPYGDSLSRLFARAQGDAAPGDSPGTAAAAAPTRPEEA